MHEFSSLTTPTELECFCHFHRRHARIQRIIRRVVSYMTGAALAAFSFHEFLIFLWIGPDYLFALSLLEAFGAYALLMPLFRQATINPLERKTEECLNQLHSHR